MGEGGLKREERERGNGKKGERGRRGGGDEA